jgi:hypothetical protein
MTREEKLDVVKNMTDKDRAEFYKKEMETQIKIVFEVSRERNELRKELQKWKDSCKHPLIEVYRNSDGSLECKKCGNLVK